MTKPQSSEKNGKKRVISPAQKSPIKPDYLLIGIGLIVLLFPILFIAIKPNLYPLISFHLRVITAMGGALVGASLPGILEVRTPFARGAGAMAVFLLIFYVNPPHLAREPKNGEVSITDNSTEGKSADYGPNKVRIDFRDGVTGYPAAFVSLDKAQVIPVPASLKDMIIEADLWVEPRDPELTGMGSIFEEARHLGHDTWVALSGSRSFNEITAVPKDIQWLDKLPKSELFAGNVFFARSSNNRLYKVLIEEWDRGPEEFRYKDRPESATLVEFDEGLGGYVVLLFSTID